MNKRIFSMMAILVFFLGFASIPLNGAHAQTNSSIQEIHFLTKEDQVTSDQITFAQVGQEEATLTGPYDGLSILFGLPADWKLSDGATVELSMGISFNNILNTTDAPAVSGGLMTVQFNSITAGILSLNQIGEQVYHLSIPAAALKSTRTDGRMELSLQLDAGYSCDFDQQMIVVVHPTSFLNLPHESVAPDTNLTNFPKPIYQNSVFKDSALIVIPDEPSEAELQSALTVAAGLGNITKNNLTLDLATASEVTPEQLSNNHLILIGTANSLPFHSDLQLPMPVEANGFQMQGGSQDDGVIQLVSSTWSSAHVALLISGNTDTGIVKAAQAISTGVLRPNRLPNLAIIDAVQTRPIPTAQAVDQTLAELGYETDLIEGRGLNTLSYEFYIPPGWTVANDSYFEMIFAHSTLINFDRSGLVVLLNGVPIGSAQLTEATAANNKNQVKIDLPANEVLPGINTLDVEADMLPLDNCSTPNIQGLWATIWSDSYFHLPLVVASTDPTSSYDLADFPSPFTFDLLLGNTAFVLPHKNSNVWRTAVRIAEYLGDQGNPPMVMLKSFYGDQVSENERAGTNFLVVGRASQLSFINELNESLPAPFSENSDMALENSMQVIFRFPPETSLGYLQMLTSPWNSERVILGVQGSTDEGVAWSGAALIEAPMRSQIAGNFSVVNDQQVISTDTRLPIFVQQTPVSEEVPGVTPPDVQPPQSVPPASTYHRPGWILVALGISSIMAFVVLLGVVYTSWMRNRTKWPKNED